MLSAKRQAKKDKNNNVVFKVTSDVTIHIIDYKYEVKTSFNSCKRAASSMKLIVQLG